MSKVSEEQYIKDLEHDMDTLSTMVLDLRKENEKLKGTYRGDEWRIEQYNRNRSVDNQVSSIEEMEKEIQKTFETEYVYERNPDTGQVYRRELGDYDSLRTAVDSNGNPLPEQLELFPLKA